MLFFNRVKERKIKAKEERKREQELIDDIRRGIFFYEIPEKSFVRVDPLVAYVRIREHGFDVFGEEIEGVMRSDANKTKSFQSAMCDVFGFAEYDGKTDEGLTLLDMLHVYMSFFQFVMDLKKNVPFLQEYAPPMEERLKSLYVGFAKKSGYATPRSSSDSTSTSPTPPPSPDTPSTSEQAEPGTV